jgi:chorismate mutase
MEVKSLASWGMGDLPLIIAGPCSAESEKQVMDIARALKATGRVSLFRSGIWKPRSRPGTFIGEGEKALAWLKRVKEETGLPVAVEIASPAHVEAALNFDIDALWLGARTVSNPFSVDEIVRSLAGTDIPVMVKNPLSPDIELWLGALERLSSAGLSRLAGILRGFTPYGKSRYRNIPKWELAIELRRRIPSLPVFCDPSHMTGQASLVPIEAQRALDMNMSGLMIEVHCDPSSALTDKEQQLNPHEFSDLLKSLVFRKPSSDDTGYLSHIEELRDQIDSIDYQIIDLISQRMKVSEKIGEYKWLSNVSVFQLERWIKILNTRLDRAEEEDLDRSFMESVLQTIHEESIRRQAEVMDELRTRGSLNGVDDSHNK